MQTAEELKIASLYSYQPYTFEYRRVPLTACQRITSAVEHKTDGIIDVWGVVRYAHYASPLLIPNCSKNALFRSSASFMS